MPNRSNGNSDESDDDDDDDDDAAAAASGGVYDGDDHDQEENEEEEEDSFAKLSHEEQVTIVLRNTEERIHRVKSVMSQVCTALGLQQIFAAS